jgi:hypothetical protein
MKNIIILVKNNIQNKQNIQNQLITNLTKNNKNNKNINLIFYDKDKLYDLYDARFINPPFFDMIIILNEYYKNEDLEMIYNMIIMNGHIIFNNENNGYSNFFKKDLYKTNKNISNRNSKNKNFKKILENYYILKKPNNYIYQFKKSRVVDFIIMGTQKGGTTALSLNISKHPDIYMNTNKDPALSEVHFYDINWYKGLDWYKKKFNYSFKMVGEKTPELMYLEYTFPLIQRVNPYVKIILILRNPIIRAYSGWKHAKKYLGEIRTFEKAIENALHNKNSNKNNDNLINENKTFYTSQFHYLERGLYFKQIQNILKWFSKDNLLILINEEVLRNMEHEYNKVYNFLNLDDYKGNYGLEYVSNNKSAIDKKLYETLIDYFKDDVKNLEKFLKIKTHWF